MRRQQPQSQPFQWGNGVFVYFLLPVVAFALTALFLNSRTRSRGVTPPLPPSGTALEVSGLTGVLAGENGARVEVRLSPLHADPDRQRFDQVQLRRRFGLGPGEPWRLELRYHADPGRPADEQAGLDLADLRVVNTDGSALVDLAATPLGSTGSPDPLATLLARVPKSVAPGQSAQRFLWGLAPVAGAQVTGLVRRAADDSVQPLFAPKNPQAELALISAALQQDRELALFHDENEPPQPLEGQR